MTQPKPKATETSDRQPPFADPLAQAMQSSTEAMLDMAKASRALTFASLRAGLSVQEEAMKSAMVALTGMERATVAAGEAARDLTVSGMDATRATLEQWNVLVSEGLRKQMELMAFPVSQSVK
ncbi:hypothetical protein [Chloracidobacterium aggregatum]|uniref:Phasin domain-containing protein n=1 Tax=Chloracidobacterium sp. N TaxID=2821540 RepID=A0ABX8B3K8_9BACT|nr:hypothetical protein [Chloracidobacterium aggregatum]QUV86610.1 hypothetical protein J8C03_13395 [Chloracidobacterium sp. 2]QUV88958.1 hypothetical protein J8C07_14075 [Chloracidobacterium sp. S]QUV92233.1 hypothetical protein J8C04_15130 [Chloracidobacterium sp. A]QUV95509.1 hypothetical protein J8C05_11765 [Chloracidobacterium sp. N]QUV98731.1 hypothetical protein J8C00_12990 [Chloracidobacterium sp. E]